jgi:hypothetical protein
MRVARNTYSVPSRYIGEELTVRVHPDTIELFYRGKRLDEYPRLRGDGQHRIDYRHIIDSLVRKPGAFTNYRFREELFPTLVFRRAYDALVAWRGERAYVDYVRILHLAAHHTQSEVETALEISLAEEARFGSADIEALVVPRASTPAAMVAAIPALTPSCKQFDELISGECHAILTQEVPIAC